MPKYKDLEKVKNLLDHTLWGALERNASLKELKPTVWAVEQLMDKVMESADNGEITDEDCAILLDDCGYIVDCYRDLEKEETPSNKTTVRMELNPLCRL